MTFAADGASWWPLLLGALFAFAESALGAGAIVPGEVAITSLATSIDTSQTVALVALVAVGAVAGDHMGYLLGRHFGPRLRRSNLIKRVGTDKWDKASDVIDRHGFPALVVSRLLPFIRTVMPAVAGAGGLKYRRFLVATLAGSLAWATLWVGAGTTIGASSLLSNPARLVGIVVAVAALAVIVRAVVRSRPR